MMTELLFQPVMLASLAMLLTTLAVLGYLLNVRGKSAATWWLAAVFTGISVFFLTNVIRASLLDIPLWSLRLIRILHFLGTGIAIWSLLQFAYRFLENPFPREARIVLWVTGVLLALDIGRAAYILWGFGTGDPAGFHSPLLLGFILWGTVVLLRKRRRARREADSEAQRRAARAYRAYALLNGLIIVFLMMQALVTAGVLTLEGVLGSLAGVTMFGFFFGLVVVYINHAPEPTTLQAKLVGLALVTAMALLVAVSELKYPQNIVEEARVAPPEREALRFTPEGAGGYAISDPVIPYDDSDLGVNLALGDDTTKAVALGFAFPFGRERWDSLYVSPNGAVTFGAPIYQANPVNSNVNYFYTPLPKIAPLYVDLDASAGGGVYLERAADQATITWHDVPQFNRAETRNRVQLVLYRDGTVVFVYDVVTASTASRVRGLTPAGATRSLAGNSQTEEVPFQLAAGAAWVDDFSLRYRLRAHDAIKDLVWLTLIAAFFILLVFPFFFRSSLIQPLGRLRQGVQRVNAGDLETEVPVGVRDEIGYLTHHFNRMTQSLRRYSGEMEALVEERTAALNRSLEELKAAQQQLVHSEKMASLGALTAGIAHEIKNPLNFVNNFAQLSEELVEELEDVTDPEEIKAILTDLKTNAEKIREHGQRADSIVRSMMQHARGGGGHRERVDLNTFVDEYVDLAWHGRRALQPDFNVHLVRDYGEGIGSVEVVPQDLGRVLINLLSNAFDAVVEQKAKLDGQYAPTVRIATCRSEEGQVEIRVADNGAGIPGEVRAKIFEPFFTTKPTGSGTGLGLSMSYDIVRQGHGGTLTVESEEGKGAAFVVTLPGHQQEPVHLGYRRQEA